MKQRWNITFSTENGATAIEYGLIAALVAVVIIGGLTALGTALGNKFENVAETVEPAAPGSSTEETPDTPTPSQTPEESTPTPEATVAGTPIPMDTATATVESKPTVIADALCWKGPGTKYEVVSALMAGVDVDVIGVGILQGWLIIDNPRYPGAHCWVPAESIMIPASMNLPGTIFEVPPVPTSTPDDPREKGCSVDGQCKAPCPVPGQYPVCYK
jgi:pilus assembly protein Flp/PilA